MQSPEKRSGARRAAFPLFLFVDLACGTTGEKANHFAETGIGTVATTGERQLGLAELLPLCSLSVGVPHDARANSIGSRATMARISFH